MTQVKGQNQMSKKKRRRHSAKFKAKVAQEAVKEIKTSSEIGAEYEVHPAQISDWKRQLLGNLDSAFEKGSQSKDQEDFTEERDKLRAKIGQLTMEVEWLQKKCVQLGLDIDEK
jgi:transposase